MRRRLTPNLFAISFGLAGVTQCWAAAAAQHAVPSAVADAGWFVVAAVWLVTAVLYGHNLVAGGRLRTEMSDPVFSPFLAIPPIVGMLLGVALGAHARTAGIVVYAVFLVATLLLGGWLSGQWIAIDRALAAWHPGYFLPTVAGGLIAAVGAAQLGFPSLARFLFGYGVVCWLVLGSILLLRLFVEPRLPVPLRPTMAIEMAPPAVAGIAWFAINGGRADALAWGLAGYALLMAMVQLRLVPVYRTVPFGLGYWAFSFSYAAAFTVLIRWMAVADVPGQRAWTILLVSLATAGLAVLLVATVRGLARNTFLPAPAPAPATEPQPVR
ncbi:TDT family transporter [Actinoplanes solisilvae]|uniref:SLAC1 family transporter n=1 Tax=Actinoplanes solisilvae TaxID=2486853 RepID=UPI0013E3CFA5|nr:TDT family transporter [Actinoplanes solisilvae]